jgi:hypothetical protein
MLRNRKGLHWARSIALVAAVCVPAVGMSASFLTGGRDGSFELNFASPVEAAAVTFIRAMGSGDAATVWFYATEEEQDAFGTTQAMYEAYREEFPLLTVAKSAAAEREWQEGDASFVEVKIVDAQSNQYSATMGFWLSDANDWQLISCDVKPLSDRIASR